jgi:predicted DNA-binding transcriptional regulator AlpA
MKITRIAKGIHFKAAINASPQDCMVFVSADHASHFKTVPKDGRTYIVEDPRRAGIQHWTEASGKYCLLDANKRVPGMRLKHLRHFPAVRKQQKKARAKKHQPRVAADSVLVIDAITSDHPESNPTVCLIDIGRVMRICGFKKSFIYEHPGFPQPIRLGSASRSAARWVESEIINWVTNLAAKRDRMVIVPGKSPLQSNA